MIAWHWVAGCSPKMLPASHGSADVAEGIAARAILRGGHGFGLSVEVIGDTNGDGLPELYVAQSGPERQEDGGDLLIASPLSGGDAETLAVARLPFGYGQDSIADAGDTDNDGYDDLWLGRRLYRGPLSGIYTQDSYDAIFESFLGRAVVGGFDADADGQLDVAFGGRREDLVVQYGPFDGVLVGYDRSDDRLLSSVTVTERGEDCQVDALQMLAQAPAMQGVFLIAGSGTTPLCAGSFRIYDVSGPRGRLLRLDDAIAQLSADLLAPWPDSNGDGQTDLLYLHQPLLSPVSGRYPSATDERWPPVLSFLDSGEILPTGDVTGDGLGDLLVQHIPSARDVPPSWYAVPGITRGTDLDLSQHGVRLHHEGAPRWTWGDLDLDGLVELIASRQGGAAPGEVWIYKGEDVAAAFRKKEAS